MINHSVNQASANNCQVELIPRLRREAILPALYLVATPIGNLGELSPRAQAVLANVTMVLCEDTRHSAKLLGHYAITTRCMSLHKFNERQRLETITAKLQNNEPIALISDAGAPAISDPGTRLVRDCYDRGIPVIPISGPSAITNAAMASGLSDEGYVFGGFVPAKQQAAKEWLQRLFRAQLATVVFVPPRKIVSVLSLLQSMVGDDHQVWIGREMTKHYEQLSLASISSHLQHFSCNKIALRGEFTVVIAKLDSITTEQMVLSQMAKLFIDKKVSVATASTIMAKLSGLPRNNCYQACQFFKESHEHP